jgi:hypothetical protein|tara:strand:+ start:7684 stop:8274 length:591 start_codon:yes stop_codon:yes gene_type:complete
VVLDSLLAGLMLFGSFSARTPNVQPNADDYEISIGFSHDNIYVNRQWERELGEPYIDDLVWIKWDKGIYFKPEYLNKESRSVKYFKIDWRSKWKDWTYGFTSRNQDDNLLSRNFETFASFGVIKKKKYLEKIDVEFSFDGYFPPSQEESRDSFEFENKFKMSYPLTKKVRLYNLGEISKLQGKNFYKAKVGLEYSL